MMTWTSNAATTTGATWNNWNFGQGSSTSASIGIIWNQWTTNETASAMFVPYWAGGATSNFNYPEQTEEEKEAARVINEERERQCREVEERAEKILTENLDEEQRKTYAERKVIPITTAKGRKYLIKRGRAGNVYRIDEHGKEIERFCIHPEESMPDQDCMLAQLLWLKFCEDQFLETANKTRLAA